MFFSNVSSWGLMKEWKTSKQVIYSVDLSRNCQRSPPPPKIMVQFLGVKFVGVLSRLSLL